MAQGWKGSYYRYREFFLNISALYEKRRDLRDFLEIVLSITTVIVFLLFALKPTILTIVDLWQQINEEKQTLTVLTQKIDDLQTATTLLTQNQNFIQDIDIAVPNFPNPDVLSKQIEGISSKDSTEVLAITIDQLTLVGSASKVATSKDLKPLEGGSFEMPFSISIKGGYTNLINFVKDFENLRVAVKIDSLAITSSLSDKGRVIVATISGRVPFLGDNNDNK